MLIMPSATYHGRTEYLMVLALFCGVLPGLSVFRCRQAEIAVSDE
jgi:hypothetical protein